MSRSRIGVGPSYGLPAEWQAARPNGISVYTQWHNVFDIPLTVWPQQLHCDGEFYKSKSWLETLKPAYKKKNGEKNWTLPLYAYSIFDLPWKPRDNFYTSVMREIVDRENVMREINDQEEVAQLSMGLKQSCCQRCGLCHRVIRPSSKKYGQTAWLPKKGPQVMWSLD